MVSVSIAAYLVVLAGTPGHLSWKASLYYYAAMFFVASVAWMFVKPRHVIVYSPGKGGV
jgi:cyanate permease